MISATAMFLSVGMIASGPVTNTLSVNALRGTDAAIRHPVRIKGTITAAARSGWVLRDDCGGIVFRTLSDAACAPGDLVEFTGWAQVNNMGDVKTVSETLAVIEHGRPPSPIPAQAHEIASGKFDFRSVIVKGVITDAFKDEVDANWNWLSILSDNAFIQVSVQDRDLKPETLEAFVDAEVSVRGTCLPINNGLRAFLGRRVEIASLGDIKVLRSPPANPFALEESATLDLSERPDEGRLRQRLTGTVIATWRTDRLFLRMRDGCPLRVRLRKKNQLPPVGTQVSAVGFVRKSTFFVTLADTAIRIEHPPEKPPSAEVRRYSAAGILEDKFGNRQINARLDGQLIRIAGTVRSVTLPRTESGRLLLDCDGNDVAVELGIFPPPEEGSVIEVSGACLINIEQNDSWTGLDRLTGFSVIPRSAGDIRVLVRPPWWTPGRFLVVIGMLLAILSAILIWNRTLRILVDRRSRELFRSQLARIESDFRTDERTRLAVELHDSIAQNLTAVSYRLATARDIDDPEDANAVICAAEKMLKSCRTELRRCLWDLRNDTLNCTDFAEAIRLTLEPVLGDAKLDVDFTFKRSRFSDSTAHMLLCILRELTSNAVRHGNASMIVIHQSADAISLTLTVTDDGCGFDPEHCSGADQGHYGLSGIRERLKRQGGSCSIDSTPGLGTTATIVLPRANRKDPLR